MDTHRPDAADEQRPLYSETLELAGRSLQLLELQR
jgi:glycogen operon protein